MNKRRELFAAIGTGLLLLVAVVLSWALLFLIGWALIKVGM